jgi:LacI family transcriptional regulator
MKDRPTGMVTSEDLIACGIIQGYQENGFSVPEDISIVCFDNSIPATVVTPKLTTINQFMRKKAERAVAMLLRAMEDPTYRDDLEVMDVDLVKRRSVARL